MAKGVLAILGSGETAPGMTKVHRELLSRLAEVRAVNLDTPYGFQLNVPQMTQKLVDYFKVSLQTDLKPLSFTNYEESSGVERELFRQSVRDSTYVFAGPGSPTYALSQWKGLYFEEDLFEVLANGGSVCFSSAAALTLGAFTAPIYEIYKAGSPLYWLEGLNLMGLIGLNCVIIPHFNNNEGENYDTSCCYLGKSRLDELEKLLPPETAILGIDEHTAVILDLGEQTIAVSGKGSAYWQHNGNVVKLSLNSITQIESLKNENQSIKERMIDFTRIPTTDPLELATLIEQGGEIAVGALSKLVSIANDGKSEVINFANLIESILEVRQTIKKEGNYQISDQIRDAFVRAGINVEDSPTGSKWSYLDRRN